MYRIQKVALDWYADMKDGKAWQEGELEEKLAKAICDARKAHITLPNAEGC